MADDQHDNTADPGATPESRFRDAWQSRDMAGSRIAAEEMLAAHKDSMPPEVQGNLHYIIGTAIMEQQAPGVSDLDTAIAHFKAGIPLTPHDPDSVANAYLHIGRAETARAQRNDQAAMERALAAFVEAKARFTDRQDTHKVAQVTCDIGRVHDLLGDASALSVRLALEAYKESHSLFAQSDRRLGHGNLAYHAGNAGIRLFDLTRDPLLLAEARRFLHEAFDIYQAARLPDQMDDVVELLRHINLREAPAASAPARLVRSAVRFVAAASARGVRAIGVALGAARAKFRMSSNGFTSSQILSCTLEAELRPRLLASWVQHHVSADAERAQFLHDLIIKPVESEGEAMLRDARRRKDPDKLAMAKHQERESREYYRYLLEIDRESSTHERGLSIIKAHLERNEPYVLLLRNFDLELAHGKLPKERERGYEAYGHGSPIEHVSTLVTYRNKPLEKLEHALVARVATIEVSDAADAAHVSVSREVSGLRVLTSEWQLVVSMLIGEAAAVVILVQYLTASLQQELALIEAHKAVGKTSIVLFEPDDLMADILAMQLQGYEKDKRRLAYEVVHETLRQRFGYGLLQLEKLMDQNCDAIVERIVTCAKAGRSRAPAP